MAGQSPPPVILCLGGKREGARDARSLEATRRAHWICGSDGAKSLRITTDRYPYPYLLVLVRCLQCVPRPGGKRLSRHPITYRQVPVPVPVPDTGTGYHYMVFGLVN